MVRFVKTIKCSLRDLYRCEGVEGFNDLIEVKLDSFILDQQVSDLDWEIVGVDCGDQSVLIEISGELGEETC